MDCSQPFSSVHGIFQVRVLERLPFPTPGDLPGPGIKPVSLASPALADEFFTTTPPGEPFTPSLNIHHVSGTILGPV